MIERNKAAEIYRMGSSRALKQNYLRMENTVKYSSVLVLIFSLTALNLFSQNDDVLFRKYVVSSGWNGLFYGGAIDAIAEINGAAATGVPIITSGICVLIPLVSNTSRKITTNQLMLSGHGKTLGWVHGFALSSLVLGKDAWDDDGGDYYKYTIGLGALSSIGLGFLGKSLSGKNDWTEGEVAIYRHYGWIMPFAGFSVAAAFSSDIRVVGGSILAFGAGGYFLADRVNKIHQYSRGEVRATRVLAVLNGGLGYGILSDLSYESDINNIYWLIPAAGVLSGTLAGHLWLKNTHLTPQQGLITAYASSGGAIMGLGIALVVNSEKPTPWYLIPYTTALGAYSFTVNHFKKINSNTGSLPGIDNKKNNWDITLMPQNLFFNSIMQNKGFSTNGHGAGIQPVFAASVNF